MLIDNSSNNAVNLWLNQKGPRPSNYDIATYMHRCVSEWYADVSTGMDILASADLDRLEAVMLAIDDVGHVEEKT